MDDLLFRSMQINNRLMVELLRVADTNEQLSTPRSKEMMCGFAVEIEALDREYAKRKE